MLFSYSIESLVALNNALCVCLCVREIEGGGYKKMHDNGVMECVVSGKCFFPPSSGGLQLMTTQHSPEAGEWHKSKS